MKKGSNLPRYRCLKCGREQSRRGFPPCRYCGANTTLLKLIRFGWDGEIKQFKLLEVEGE